MSFDVESILKVLHKMEQSKRNRFYPWGGAPAGNFNERGRNLLHNR